MNKINRQNYIKSFWSHLRLIPCFLLKQIEFLNLKNVDFFILVCICVCPLCMSVGVLHMSLLTKVVRGGCQILMKWLQMVVSCLVGTRSWTWISKATVLLTAKPSLPAPFRPFFFWNGECWVMVALTNTVQISPLPGKSLTVVSGQGVFRKICQLQRYLHLCESSLS